jgi:hypothetical protein
MSFKENPKSSLGIGIGLVFKCKMLVVSHFAYCESINRLKLSHYTPRRCLGEMRYSSYSLMTSVVDGGE